MIDQCVSLVKNAQYYWPNVSHQLKKLTTAKRGNSACRFSLPASERTETRIIDDDDGDEDDDHHISTSAISTSPIITSGISTSAIITSAISTNVISTSVNSTSVIITSAIITSATITSRIKTNAIIISAIYLSIMLLGANKQRLWIFPVYSQVCDGFIGNSRCFVVIYAFLVLIFWGHIYKCAIQIAFCISVMMMIYI